MIETVTSNSMSVNAVAFECRTRRVTQDAQCFVIGLAPPYDYCADRIITIALY